MYTILHKTKILDEHDGTKEMQIMCKQFPPNKYLQVFSFKVKPLVKTTSRDFS